MAESSRVMTGIRRGLGLHCPNCGEGRLFARYLKVAERCESCQTDNTIYPADDAPPYLTIFLVGHLVLPFVFWSDTAWSPPMWVLMAIWLPLIAAATLATLPFMKGAVIGIAWANGVTRETARQ